MQKYVSMYSKLVQKLQNKFVPRYNKKPTFTQLAIVHPNVIKDYKKFVLLILKKNSVSVLI